MGDQRARRRRRQARLAGERLRGAAQLGFPGVDRSPRVPGGPAGLRGQGPIGGRQADRRRVPDGSLQAGELVPEPPDPRDELSRAGRRCLEGQVGDVVGHAAVHLVPEARQHRVRAGGDGPGHDLGVERGQVRPGTTPAHHQDHVQLAPAERAYGRGHHLRRPLALDAGVAGHDPEAEPAGLQLVGDVVPRRAADARDQPDCERQHRRGQPSLGVVQPGGDQPADQLVALEGQLPQRVPRVDPAHLQAQPAAGGEEVQVAVEPDLHAVGQAQPVALQQRAELEPDVGEEADRDGGADALVVIGQGEVEVAVALADALDLAPHPDALVEAAAQRAVDRLRQLGDREGREAAVVDVLEAEVEAGLAHERSGRQWVRTGTVRQYCPS